jgi:hypothetical protein
VGPQLYVQAASPPEGGVTGVRALMWTRRKHNVPLSPQQLRQREQHAARCAQREKCLGDPCEVPNAQPRKQSSGCWVGCAISTWPRA